jgi:hypothetical protein
MGTEMTDAVSIPARLRHRPRDARGYVIPFVQFIGDDGLPNFAVMDHRKVSRCLRQRRCGLCGEVMGIHLYFIGGDLCVVNRYFYDPPMHRDCAIYALEACPHLARSKGRYREPPTSIEGATIIVGDMQTKKAERFALMHTGAYTFGKAATGMLTVKAAPWIDVQWWKEGSPVDVPAS